MRKFSVLLVLVALVALFASMASVTQAKRPFFSRPVKPRRSLADQEELAVEEFADSQFSLKKIGKKALPLVKYLPMLLSDSEIALVCKVNPLTGKRECTGCLPKRKPIKLTKKALQEAESLSDAEKFSLKSIGKIGKKALPYVKYLPLILSESDSEAEKFSLKSLGKIGKKALPYVKYLPLILSDSEAEAEKFSLKKLGKIGKKALPYAKYLAILLSEAEAEAQSELQSMSDAEKIKLGKIVKIGKVVAPLLLSESEAEAEKISLKSIGKIGKIGKKALPYVKYLPLLLAEE